MAVAVERAGLNEAFATGKFRPSPPIPQQAQGRVRFEDASPMYLISRWRRDWGAISGRKFHNRGVRNP
jgi:hypothetical protein